MTIPPARTILNPAGRYSQVIRNPCTGTVDIACTYPGICCHSAGTIQIVPGTAEIDPAGSHSTGAGEVIPGIAKFQPAGNHPARLIKIIPLSFNVFPAIGSVAAVLMTIPPAGTVLDPAGSVFYFAGNPGTGCVDIVGTDPGIRSHSTVRIHIIISIIYDMPAAAIHGTVFREVVPPVAKICPSGKHDTGRIQIIPTVTKMKPSGMHNTILIQIIPGFSKFQPIVADHISTGVEIIPMPIDTFPLTDRVSTIRTLIPVTISIFSPVFVFVIWNPYAISSVIFISNPGGCNHRSVRIESIFGTIDGMCTGVHSTICPQIIPDIIKLDPSCDHGTGRRGKIVIIAINIDPSGCSLTGGIHIIPGIIIFNKLIRQRS